MNLIISIFLLLLFASLFLIVIGGITGNRVVLLCRDRVNVVLGYLFLLALDCLIVLTTKEEWIAQRWATEETVVHLWNRHKMKGE